MVSNWIVTLGPNGYCCYARVPLSSIQQPSSFQNRSYLQLPAEDQTSSASLTYVLMFCGAGRAGSVLASEGHCSGSLCKLVPSFISKVSGSVVRPVQVEEFL